jgi:REP element-mobilizing transposase RayT
MSRAPRTELVGDLFHVIARGVARHPIFVDDVDRRRYLSLLARTTRKVHWRCLSYCLMDNHIHLLLEAAMTDVSKGMHRLQGEYARAFNRRHRGSGHLFQDRFRPVPIATDKYFLTVVQYIVNNPVKAGLCTEPEDWPWSSHAAILRGDAPAWLDVRRVFDYLGEYGGDPRQRYAELLKGARHL